MHASTPEHAGCMVYTQNPPFLSISTSQAWPRTAYFVRGEGRRGIDGMSDFPVKTPFQPLRAFITEVQA